MAYPDSGRGHRAGTARHRAGATLVRGVRRRAERHRRARGGCSRSSGWMLRSRNARIRVAIRFAGTALSTSLIFRSSILAVAYLNLNRSQEAVDLLENVQRDGLVVEGDDQFPRFTNVLGDARRRVAAEAARAEAARAEAARVAEAAEVSEQLERSALLAFYTGDYEGARAGLDRLISEAPTARAYLFLASSQVGRRVARLRGSGGLADAGGGGLSACRPGGC